MTDPASSEGDTRGLAHAFVRRVREDGLLSAGDRLILAFSGGVDSAVLLHLFRFRPELADLEIVAAHFDHAMRPDSRKDMLWARGLCRAWQVPFHSERAQVAPASEDEARERRYDFLLRQRDIQGASWVITGHQADDQAETVLFRICRGTGLRGLGGMPRHRPPGLYRPLLSFYRHEILGYARGMKVPFRRDPTNQDLTNPRNQLRHETIPQLQAGPAPQVRESLVRLARLAKENEVAWESLLPDLLDGVLREERGSLFVVRSGLLAYHPAVQTRLLREVLRRRGIELEEAGTRVLLEFTRTGVSGRSMSLPGGWRLVREFDRFLLIDSPEAGSDEGRTVFGSDEGRTVFGSDENRTVFGSEEGRTISGSNENRTAFGSDEGRTVSGSDEGLTISRPEEGHGGINLEGKEFEVHWGPMGAEGFEEGSETRTPAFDETLEVLISDLGFPLTLRGWRAGDRIQLSYGTKKLKKLLSEARIPLSERGRVPVLSDAVGRILWVPGVATSNLLQDHAGSGDIFFLGIRNVDS